jgi:hypothetical protein
MPVIVVANPKGGVGKSTISTHIAGYFASRGHAVMLGDVDVQQSSKLWLQLRPLQARPIQSWDIDADNIAKPPKGVTHVVLDTPAGLHGKRLREVIKRADRIVVPLQASGSCFVAGLTPETTRWPYSGAMKTFQTLNELPPLIGQEVAVSDWITITQEQVNLFAQATGDHQWIHVDVERAKAGPFGAPIAHGFLTLSLLAPFL